MYTYIHIYIYNRHGRPGSNTDAEAEAALSVHMCLDGFLIGSGFSSLLAPLASETLGLVVKKCKSIVFSKELYDFLAKGVILVEGLTISW